MLDVYWTNAWQKTKVGQKLGYQHWEPAPTSAIFLGKEIGREGSPRLRELEPSPACSVQSNFKAQEWDPGKRYRDRLTLKTFQGDQVRVPGLSTRVQTGMH